MLERIKIRRYLATGLIEQVTCGGESGPEARICDYAWILDTMQQCVEYDVPFWFKQTGTKFKKGNRIYHIERERPDAPSGKGWGELQIRKKYN